ncbi:cyclic nucleotide-gated channel cone photoreceptor subunit alpha-like [Littorina saxatilis]|uniref:cyclic nucleotide-gated channel cone photoreceptor subunit alpha-like n=1 Tax=Littorina saxatilis TaxID=31220 RepID=UPI0038B46519
MSGVLTRGRANDSGVSVRYTPCAKSDKSEEEVRAEEEEEEEVQEEISILRRDGSGRRGHVAGGRGKGAGSTGSGGSGGGSVSSKFRLRAGSESIDDDYDIAEEDSISGDQPQPQRGTSTLASLTSGDLELTECPHLPRQDSTAGSGVGSSIYEGGREGGRSGADSASCGDHSITTISAAAAVPGTSSTQTPTANGPRHLPGLDLFAQGSERTKLIGERLSSTDKISLSSPIYSNKVVEQRDRSSSRQSLLEIVSNKLDRVRTRKRFSLAQGSLLKKPRLSEANVNVISNRVTRKQRRKDIEEKFGKRKSIRGGDHIRVETAASTSSDHDGCNWTFVFDPSGRLCYWWSSVVSVAFLYNFWVIIYRFAFQEINKDNIAVWFTLDYTADLLYVLDIIFHFRTGYLEDGVLQTDPAKLRIHYTNTTTFYIDCLCLLPLDFLYLSIGFRSILRGFRLVKVYRFWAFVDRTERHTNYPNVVRSATLMHYLIALFHWNACLYYIVAIHLDRRQGWRFPKENGVALQYLHALHWSLVTLTTVGTPPTPRTEGEYAFVIFEVIFALVLFATFLGHIANIVTNVSAARKEFQGESILRG